ncbi:MAG: 4-hydroxybenzoate polyprenyltransferase [Alphaproteobacteria bacterium]|jgi:4-hydroxybenzoate polyprenyltransferase
MRQILYVFWQLMRPHQYIKNTFVFAGVVFAHQWTWHILCHASYIFIAFCCISSSVYILNDIIDIENDRHHPKKSKRPLPSGRIGIKSAFIALLILLSIAVSFAYYISLNAVIFVGLYFVLNIFYSLHLKNIVILDVVTISIGFMFRILAGTYGLHIMPSQWILLCGLMVTLFLGFSKRFCEISALENTPQKIGTTRPVLADYTAALLERFMVICATCTIMCYGLYTTASETLKTHNTDNLIYSLPIVTYGILRYLYLVYTQKKGGDTSLDILTDRHMYITIIAWLCVIIGIFVW